MRFGGDKNSTLFVLVAVVTGFPLLIWESHGFASRASLLPSSSTLTRRIETTAAPLHLLNANRITEKQKFSPHCELSHPKQSSSWDNFMIPLSERPNQQQLHDHITKLDKILVAGFIGIFGATLYQFVTSSSPGSWRYFLAGGLCAASSHAIPTPIDVIKVCSCWLVLCFSGKKSILEFLSHGIIRFRFF
jgi:hypothetical protein